MTVLWKKNHQRMRNEIFDRRVEHFFVKKIKNVLPSYHIFWYLEKKFSRLKIFFSKLYFWILRLSKLRYLKRESLGLYFLVLVWTYFWSLYWSKQGSAELDRIELIFFRSVFKICDPFKFDPIRFKKSAIRSGFSKRNADPWVKVLISGALIGQA